MKYMSLLCHLSKLNTGQRHHQNYFFQFIQNRNVLVLVNIISFLVLTEPRDEMVADIFIIFYQIKKKIKFVILCIFKLTHFFFRNNQVHIKCTYIIQ